MKKRIIALLLTVAMVFSLVPSAVWAEPIDGSNDDVSVSTPSDDNANVSITKSATRTSKDTWDITLNITPTADLQQAPLDVVLVFDTSNSMKFGIDTEENATPGEQRLDYAKKAAVDLVDQMAQMPNVSMGLVEFYSSANTVMNLTSLPEGAGALKEKIEALSTHASTNMGAGLLEGQKVLDASQNGSANKVIILLADGQDAMTPPIDPNASVETAAEIKAKGTTIYTIGFAQAAGVEQLPKIASTPEYFYPAEDADALVDSFERIALELTALVSDDVGDEVNIVGDVKADINGEDVSEHLTMDSDSMFHWDATDGTGLSSDEVLKITYPVQITDDGWRQVWENGQTATLNSKVTVNARVGEDGEAQSVVLPPLQAPIGMAHLGVVLDLPGHQTEDGELQEQVSYTEDDQYAIYYNGAMDRDFEWKGTPVVDGYAYTGSTLTNNKAETLDATEKEFPFTPEAGVEYTLTHHYTKVSSPTLTYDANGGTFGEGGDSTPKSVSGLTANTTYNVWAKDDNHDDNLAVPENVAWPVHEDEATPEGSVITDEATSPVVMMGWSETKPEKIYAAGEDYSDLLSEVTIPSGTATQTTLYAVWGYDENRDGIADAQQVVITPADITIYTGGDSYDGVIDGDNGHTSGDSHAENGFPEPGFYFILPYGLNDYFDGAANMADLTDRLRLTYKNGDDTRTWDVEKYTEEGACQVGEKNVYRLTPVGHDHPVRVEIHDGDSEDVVTSDQFTIDKDTLFKQYNISLFTDSVDRNLVKAQVKDETQSEETWVDATEAIDGYTEKGIALGKGLLTIRGTKLSDPVSSILPSAPANEVENITAVGKEGTVYYNNGNVTMPVARPEEVKLLNDAVVSEGGTLNTLKDAVVKAAEGEGLAISADDAFDFRYLDLVDSSNGNMWVTASEALDIYWPYPEGTNKNDTFYIAHFDGLDRDFDVDDLQDKLEQGKVTLKLYSEDAAKEELRLEKTDQGIKFSTATFSPFALIYDEPYEPPIIPPVDPSEPEEPDEPDDNLPPALNTEDHFSYVVGYEDGNVKPQNDVTRAEVATIFYRLLKDDVREDNNTTKNNFDDVSADAWYNTTVSTLAKMGIIRGYEDGTFRPNAPITRAEFASIAARFFEKSGADYEPGTFTDVNGDEWYADAIATAVELGLLGGYEDGTVRPNNNITRAEACAVVNRTVGRVPHKDHLLPADEMKTWPDNKPSDWFYADMQEATNSHDYKWIKDHGNKVEEWTKLIKD